MSSTTRDIEQRSERKELPEGWRWVKLGDVCELNPRRPFIDRHDSELTSFIPMESVDAVLGVVSSIRERLYGEVKKGYTFFAEADVLFAKITPCMQNGKHAIAVGIIDGIGFGTTEFHVIRPSESIISEFIWFFVRQPIILADAIKHFTGAIGQQRVPEGYLAELEIPLPPLPEQQRIAAILKEQMGAVEKARTAAQERLRAIKALPSAFLRQIFPDPGQPLPEGWRIVPLGEFCQFTNGNAYKESDWDIEGVPIIRIQNLNDHQKPFNYWRGPLEKRVCVNDGDLLLAWSGTPGTSFGAHIWNRGVGVLNQHIFLVETKSDLAKDWAKFAINDALHELINASHGAVGLAHVTKGEVEALEIPLPPLPEQQRIVAIIKEQLATIEQARTAAEAELKAINTLPAALLRRAFNGEL